MSLQRCVAPATSSATFFKSAIQAYSRTCPHASRSFTSSMSIRLSSKRKLVTTAGYRPSSLDPTPPPPRNSGTPESSIADAIPQVNDIRPPVQPTTTPYQKSQESEQNESSTIVSEAEAQHSTPVPNPPNTQTIPTTTTSEAVKKTKRPKLRPRKAAMKLTPTAILQLRELLEQPEPKMIRVGVKNRGCSGLAYHLEYVDKPGSFDETVEQDGVKVLIDSKALFSIIGSEMDWIEDKLNQRFVFRNPNIKEQCGCGESFMV